MPDNRSSSLGDVLAVIGETLGLDEARIAAMSADTSLLDAVPEFDSFAVVQIAMAIEERFGVELADEDFTADVFATPGMLAAFIDAGRTGQPADAALHRATA